MHNIYQLNLIITPRDLEFKKKLARSYLHSSKPNQIYDTAISTRYQLLLNYKAAPPKDSYLDP
jgi:hypothetical protein